VIASPDRVLARVVLTAFAVVGFLLLVALELAILSAGSGDSAAEAIRCLIEPVSKFDVAVHASAMAIAVAAALPIAVGIRAASRARASVLELRDAARLARLDAMPPWVATIAAKAGVAGRIDIVEVPRPFAFAYGWIRPRICVSTGLIDLLNEAELEAVLHHEGWHAAHRDPLRLLLAQAIGVAFGAIPEIRRLVKLHVLALEVAADRHVVAQMGHPRALASALAKSVRPPAAEPGFEGHAEARAAALVGHLPTLPRGRGRVAALVLLIEIVVLLPLLTSGSIVSLAGFWIHPVC
jgi:Zn-dependent protease with chaperone function